MALRSPRDQLTPRSNAQTPRAQAYLQAQNTPKNAQSLNASAGKDKSGSTSASSSTTGAKSEDEAKDLPPEEFKDYLNQLDSEVFPLDDDGNAPFKSLDEALNEEFNINDGNFIILMIFAFSIYFATETQEHQYLGL